MRLPVPLACGLVPLAACGAARGGAQGEAPAEESDAGAPAGCPEGHAAVGPACVPIFAADCGDGEVAALGGGCERVGLRDDCWPGWRSDGHGGCEPVLPPDWRDCPVGTMPAIGSTACRPVGPPAGCWPGWRSDGDGGCEPVLPPDWRDCPDGTMPAIGSTACRPVGDCDGSIEPAPGAVYVEASAQACAARAPAACFTDVQAAIDAAPAGGQVIVGPGRYSGDLVLGPESAAHLSGVCAARVTIAGTGSERAVLIRGDAASGASLSSVTVTGPAVAVEVSGRRGVALDSVVLRDAGGCGLLARDGAEVAVRRSLLARNRLEGVFAMGATVAVEDSAVRDTRPGEAGEYGRGIDVQNDRATPEPSQLAVHRTLIAGNRAVGLRVAGSTATIGETAVRDTLGWGIAIQDDPATGAASRATIVRAEVRGSLGIGVAVLGSDASIESCTVRDTLSPPESGLPGHGIDAEPGATTRERAVLAVRRTLVAGSGGVGVLAAGSTAVVEDSAVRDGVARDLPGGGVGVQSVGAERAEATVRRTLVARNRDLGVLVSGSSLRLEEAAVLGTLAREPDGASGRGVAVQAGEAGRSRAEVRRTLVAGNRDAGLFVSGSTATVEETVVRDTLARRTGRGFGRGIGVQRSAVTGAAGALALRRSLIAANRDAGVLVAGSRAAIEQTTVRDTLAQQADGRYGTGVTATVDPASGARSQVAIRDTQVRGNRLAGVAVVGSALAIERSVVRDTLAQARDGLGGQGVNAEPDAATGVRAELTVRGAWIAGNAGAALFVGASRATIEDTTVLGESAGPGGGDGVVVQADPATGEPARATIRGVLAAGHRRTGVTAGGSPVSVESSAVRDTRAQAGGLFGDGVLAFGGASLDLRRSLVERSARAGVFFHDAGGSVEAAVLRDNALFACALERGADPAIGADVVLQGDGGRRCQPGKGLDPAPPLQPPDLSGLSPQEERR